MSDRPITALLVEDNPGDARLIREMLADREVASVDLECVDRLSTGLERLGKGGIDLVLLDLSLPDGQGLGTLSKVLIQSPQVPIIVLTGLDDEELALQAVQEGAQDYLVKGLVDGHLLVRSMHYAIERKRAEEELQASKASFRNIVEKNGDGILVANSDGVVLFVNPALRSLLGREPGELLGEIFGSSPVRRKSIEVEIVRNGNELGIGEMHLVETEWEGKHAYLLTLRDISERKQAEETLRESEKKAIKALEELKEAQRTLVRAEKLSSLGQLVAGVAHELNNPLYSVWGLSELVMKRDLTETLRRELGMIHAEAERCVKIVRNLLSFARPSRAGKLYMPVNPAIVAALEMRRYELEVNNIELDVNLQPDLPLIMGDAQEVQQVALNLIVNAEQSMIKAHDGGKLLIRTEHAGPMVRFVVRDSGPGISKEDLDQIFDPFFTTKEVGKGTGLGLSICYSIIQEHGGTIRAESEPPDGATFIVELPIVSHTAEGESKERTGPDAQRKSLAASKAE